MFSDYLFLIPARGGSKGIPNKNIKELDGKPLIAWSIEQALAVSPASNIIVSTDSERIKCIAEQYGIDVPFLRPSSLAKDTTSTEPVMLHALDWFSKHRSPVKAVVLLQPTSPFRKNNTLASAIEQFENDKADSLLSVVENHHFFWRNKTHPEPLYDFHNRPRRQDISDEQRWYRENGSIYITKSDILYKYKNRLGGKISMYLMTEEESWEIDSLTDLKIISSLIKEN